MPTFVILLSVLWHLLFQFPPSSTGAIANSGSSGPPTYVNSVANFCTYSSPICTGPNISVTSGNSLIAYISLHNQTGCTSLTITAALVEGNSLTQIGSNILSTTNGVCFAQFRINSLPTTNATEHVIFTLTGGSAFPSVGEIQSTAFTTLDANCSGVSNSSPIACSSGMSLTSSLTFAAYSDANTGGTVVTGGGFTLATSYAGAATFANTLYLGYRQVTSSTTVTPSYTDSGTVDSAVFGAALH
jgi:hypothetical protein